MTPVLYSFRRCPYAIRARLALASARQQVELREILLRDKPEAFLAVSPSATVPCLVTEKAVIDESFDVMIWALERNDPEGWLEMPAAGYDWIEKVDGPFKAALDRTKYATRYPDCNPLEQRAIASAILTDMNEALGEWLFTTPSLADYSILPFVRQFALIDKAWFDAQPWPRLHAWLERFLTSERFARVMHKYPQWRDGDEPIYYPD